MLTLSPCFTVTPLFWDFSKSMQWKSTVSSVQVKNEIQISYLKISE